MNQKVNVDGKIFNIKISRRKNKKYDVYDNFDNYLLSFGDKRYQHFFDKFGYYSDLDHGDKKRRDNYRKRHKGLSGKNINNPYKPAYWSFYYLW